MRPGPMGALADLDDVRLHRAPAALIIEDSDAWAEVIEGMLVEQDPRWTIVRAVDAESAHKALAVRLFDLLVIDRNLEPDDGLRFLEGLRSCGMRTPAILMTTMGDERDIVTGLLAGGDDYVVKPPRKAEFQARVVALLRRAEQAGVKVFGLLELDFQNNQIRFRRKPVKINQRERTVLAYLALRDPERVPMRELLEKVWGYNDSLWPDGEVRMTNPGGLVDVTFSILRGVLEEAGLPPGLVVPHRSTMSQETFDALALDKPLRVLARDLDRSWSLDAARLQADAVTPQASS